MKFIIALSVLLASVVSFGQASTGLVQGVQRRYMPIAIPAASTTSPAYDVGGYYLNGVIFPATVVGTSISFLTSDTVGGTYVQVYSTAGALLTYTTGASRFVAFNPLDLQGLRYIKIVSNATETTGLPLILALRQAN